MTSLKLSCHVDVIVVKLERLLFLCDGSETGFDLGLILKCYG